MNLNSQEYKLIPLSENYLDIIFKWRNSPHIREKMFDNSEIKIEAHYAWFNKIQSELSPYYYIFLYKNNPAGFVSFSPVDLKNKRANWGFYIGDTALPKGVSYIMGLLAFEKAFNEHNFNKIYGEVISTNEKSIRYHLQLGFKQEAFLSEHLFRNNVFEDIIVFGFTSSRWKDNLNVVEKNLRVIFPQIFKFL